MLTQADRIRSEAFEMWIWRRAEKVSWMDKKSKEEILHIDQEDRKILDTIRKRTRKWLGHVLRHSEVLHNLSQKVC